jgi:hypothetical protein
MPLGIPNDPEGYGSRKPTNGVKPVGVQTAWCVGVRTQDDPKDATWQAVFKV